MKKQLSRSCQPHNCGYTSREGSERVIKIGFLINIVSFLSFNLIFQMSFWFPEAANLAQTT